MGWRFYLPIGRRNDEEEFQEISVLGNGTYVTFKVAVENGTDVAFERLFWKMKRKSLLREHLGK